MFGLLFRVESLPIPGTAEWVAQVQNINIYRPVFDWSGLSQQVVFQDSVFVYCVCAIRVETISEHVFYCLIVYTRRLTAAALRVSYYLTCNRQITGSSTDMTTSGTCPCGLKQGNLPTLFSSGWSQKRARSWMIEIKENISPYPYRA